ncbi:MAG: amidohydrolase family protein [Micromonosporaceae bacterium]
MTTPQPGPESGSPLRHDRPGPEPESLLLRGVTMPDGSVADVRLRGERIDQIVTPGALAADHELGLAGHLLLPAPVEPHAHLDKALTAEAAPNPTGDLEGAVTAWLRHRSTMAREQLIERAVAAARKYLAHGATTVRTHVDVDDGIGLRSLSALLEVRDQLRDVMTIELVAFAGPLTGAAGAANRSLLAEAVAAGADVVGGCPYRDPDPYGCHELLLKLAAEHSLPVDLHTDETLQSEVVTLAGFADAVTRTGFRHGAVASHCVSLGVQSAAAARRIAERVAAAEIAVVCLPQTNLYLQGREHGVGVPRGLTAVRALREAGAVVAAGGDNVQDPFNSVGRADPLETASLMVMAGHDSPEQAYAAVSEAARVAMGRPAVRLAAGQPAELMAIRGDSIREAVASASSQRVVFHRGRVVARTTVEQVFVSPPDAARPGRLTAIHDLR